MWWLFFNYYAFGGPFGIHGATILGPFGAVLGQFWDHVALKWPKMYSRCPKMLPRCPKISQDTQILPQDDPKMVQGRLKNEPRWLQGGPKWCPNGPKMVPKCFTEQIEMQMQVLITFLIKKHTFIHGKMYSKLGMFCLLIHSGSVCARIEKHAKTCVFIRFFNVLHY